MFAAIEWRRFEAVCEALFAQAGFETRALSHGALDGSGLLKLIATRTDEQQQALLDVAFEGDYGRPTCASCGIKLVERTPSKGGANFWGCSNYPRCKSRLPKVVVPR